MATDNAATNTNSTKTRAVVLVARPLRRLVDLPLRKLCRAARTTAQPIDWTSANISSLPTIQDNKCYARHLALAVVDLSVWSDNSATVLDKLRRARFWEHRGSTSLFKKAKSGKAGNGEVWGDVDIMAIEAIEYVGEIYHSDHVISHHCKCPSFPAISN